MAEDLKALDRHIRACIVVFGCLMVLTVITVLASYLELNTYATVTLALCIASVKAALVLAYFMHLIDEKKIIYASLILTAFFFVVLMILPYATESDPILHTIIRRH